MLRFIFGGLMDEIMKDMIRKHEREPQRNPFLQPIEAEIERLEEIEKQVRAKLEVVKQLHRWVSEIFDLPKTNRTDSPDKPKKTPPEPAKPEPSPEPQAGSKPTPKLKRKPKEKAEYQRLPKHRATGNPRLDALETALHDALERLVNTNLAHYVKDINEVRLALIELYKAWDSPEEERLAELESGLKAAADKLSANSRAAKSKIMQDVWSNIIVALQQKDNDE